jgi:hypothetical protein
VRRFTPISAERLPARLVELAQDRHPQLHPLRLAFDGPRCADLGPLVDAVAQGLRAVGRPVAIVRTETFYRDASLRFEYGKTDVDSFYTGWLDSAALQREVLMPLGAGGEGRYLPALRDPDTNRSIHGTGAALPATGVLLLRGELLLGTGLDLDLVVHASVSRQARKRITAEIMPSWSWTLPAFDRYDIDVDPVSTADVVLRYDDPARPALAVNAA